MWGVVRTAEERRRSKLRDRMITRSLATLFALLAAGDVWVELHDSPAADPWFRSWRYIVPIGVAVLIVAACGILLADVDGHRERWFRPAEVAAFLGAAAMAIETAAAAASVPTGEQLADVAAVGFLAVATVGLTWMGIRLRRVARTRH